MAKQSKSVNFKNCVIDSENLIITEFGKDDCHSFNLRKILSDWHGIEGVSFSLRWDDDIEPDRDGE